MGTLKDLKKTLKLTAAVEDAREQIANAPKPAPIHPHTENIALEKLRNSAIQLGRLSQAENALTARDALSPLEVTPMNTNTKTTIGGIVLAVSIVLGFVGHWLTTGQAGDLAATIGQVVQIIAPLTAAGGALHLGVSAADAKKN